MPSEDPAQKPNNAAAVAGRAQQIAQSAFNGLRARLTETPRNHWIALAVALLVPGSFAFWIFTYPLGCFAILSAIPFLVLITRHNYQVVAFRNRAVASAYAKRHTRIHGYIRGTISNAVFSVAYAIFLTAGLLVSAITLSNAFILLFLLNGALFLAAHTNFTLRVFGGLALRSRFKPFFLYRITFLLNFWIIFILTVAFQIYEPLPSYITDSEGLLEAISLASREVGSRCPVINDVARIAAELRALQWIVLTESQRDQIPSIFQWLVWTSFVLNGSFVALAFSKATAAAFFYSDAIASSNKGSGDA